MGTETRLMDCGGEEDWGLQSMLRSWFGWMGKLWKALPREVHQERCRYVGKDESFYRHATEQLAVHVVTRRCLRDIQVGMLSKQWDNPGLVPTKEVGAVERSSTALFPWTSYQSCCGGALFLSSHVFVRNWPLTYRSRYLTRLSKQSPLPSATEPGAVWSCDPNWARQ